MLSRGNKLKNFLGGLDLNTIKSGLNHSKRFLNIIKDSDELAKKHDIDVVKKITDRIVNNKNFKKVEKVVDGADKVVGVIENNKGRNLFNRVDPNINKVGEKFARDRRQSVLDRSNEENMARSIVNNIK